MTMRNIDEYVNDTHNALDCTISECESMYIEFIGSLNNKTPPSQDQRKILSREYFTFTDKLSPCIEKLNALLLSISQALQFEDQRNEEKNVVKLEALMERCVSIRKILEAYFNDTDIYLNDKSMDISVTRLKNDAHLMIRKLELIKISK